MNAPRDPWEAFSAVFAEELAHKPLSIAEMDALREQYEREQIASAQSEADYQANVRSYNK